MIQTGDHLKSAPLSPSVKFPGRFKQVSVTFNTGFMFDVKSIAVHLRATVTAGFNIRTVRTVITREELEEFIDKLLDGENK